MNKIGLCLFCAYNCRLLYYSIVIPEKDGIMLSGITFQEVKLISTKFSLNFNKSNHF
jgi:hypothetical protein